MVTKVHGTASAGEFVGGDLEYVTVRTTLDLTATGTITDASQARLDALLRVISCRTQPVVLGAVTTTTETSPADLPAASGSVTVYTIKMMHNHKDCIVPATVLGVLNGVSGFVYTTPTTGNNVSMTVTASL